jgi:CRP-like cAMP-binding protein
LFFRRAILRMRSSSFKGKLTITVVSGQGREAVVALLGPKEFFGEGGLQLQAAASGRCIHESVG